VRLAIDLYEEGGYAALKPTARGRTLGDGRTLTAEQEAVIRRTICDKRPEQLKMEFALWNRAAVMQLIERDYGIKLSVRGVGNYLSRWGFTPQKPIKKAYEQRPEAVQAWLDEQYPEIEKRAKAEGGEIHWGDDNSAGQYRCAWSQLRAGSATSWGTILHRRSFCADSCKSVVGRRRHDRGFDTIPFTLPSFRGARRRDWPSIGSIIPRYHNRIPRSGFPSTRGIAGWCCQCCSGQAIHGTGRIFALCRFQRSPARGRRPLFLP